MKTYTPTTASRRHMTGIAYRDIVTKTEPEKRLTRGKRYAVGRNAHGRITTRHKGAGHKRLWRAIDFSYDKKDIPARVVSIEYDPNRSAFIALVVYRDGIKKYIVAPANLKIGASVVVSRNAEITLGNRLPLSGIPVGTGVYNIEIKPNTSARLIRSAGSMATVLAHDGEVAHIKMPSNEVRKINIHSWASIGQVSNTEHNLVVGGKAGRSRWMGIRPTVRGSAMNPVDHPYGGGEGRAPRGTRRPKNKWGKGTRGVKTRKVKKYSSRLIIQRRKTKKKY